LVNSSAPARMTAKLAKRRITAIARLALAMSPVEDPGGSELFGASVERLGIAALGVRVVQWQLTPPATPPPA
jgi:hypothetical protein